MFKHPQEVCMSYLEHMALSLQLSRIFCVGSLKAIVHAFLPDYYIKSSTNVVIEAQQMMANAGCREDPAPRED